MVPVHIDWCDGHYSMTRLDLPQSPNWPVSIMLPPEIWEAWEKHCAEARIWHHIIRALDDIPK